MNIAVIGAGYTGLSAAYTFLSHGHNVEIFEKDKRPGGLAVGYKKSNWKWSLEEHYHHWFANDKSVLELAKQINYPIISKRPKTSVYLNENVYQLDSPFHVINFPSLPLVSKIRMAATLGALRFNPFWKPLETIRAFAALSFLMGTDAYKMLWEPQLKNKFGKYYQDISLAWFWARIYKRTSNLKYPEGGYLTFAEMLVKKINELKGFVNFSTDISEIGEKDGSPFVTIKNRRETFDAVLVTIPNAVFRALGTSLPSDYKDRLASYKGLGAVNMVMRLTQEFLHDGTYWLSVCQENAPVMAIVEHTNFMDKKYYGDEHIVYFGNYVSTTSKLYSLNDIDLLKLFEPFLLKINPFYKKNIIDVEVFHAPFAQPIVDVSYSKKILPIQTPFPHVYLSNMQQVYPWDRGTNYAVELGIKAANGIMKEAEYR